MKSEYLVTAIKHAIKALEFEATVAKGERWNTCQAHIGTLKNWLREHEK